MSNRKARIPADNLGFLIFASAAVATLGALAFVKSFTALTAWAGPAGLEDRLGWIIPIAFDGAILGYTAAALVQRQRAEHKAERVSWTSLGILTGVSVAANAIYAWTHGTHSTALEQVGGTVIAGLIPLMQFAATHTLANLIVEPVAPEAVPEAVPAPEPVAQDARGRRLPRAQRDELIRRMAQENPNASTRRIAEAVGASKSTVSRVLNAPDGTASAA